MCRDLNIKLISFCFFDEKESFKIIEVVEPVEVIEATEVPDTRENHSVCKLQVVLIF